MNNETHYLLRSQRNGDSIIVHN